MILMAMTTYPLNNILYQAEDAELFHCTRTSGVYDNLDFQYSVTGADNNVTIGKGLAWIRNAEFAGKVSANKQPIVLDLGLTASVLPRIDAIVIQFDANKNATSIIVKKGEEASKPQPPKVVRTESTYELHLYHVLRNPSDATITEGVITDLRTNYDYCGIMLDDISRIDQNLSKFGYAADARVTGVKIAEINSKKLSKSNVTHFVEDKHISLTTSPTTTVFTKRIPKNCIYSLFFVEEWDKNAPREVKIEVSGSLASAGNTTGGADVGALSTSIYGYSGSDGVLLTCKASAKSNVNNYCVMQGYYISLE